MASIDIQGKTALVTGANRGIGREIVKGLIEAGAGKVYAAVRSLESADPLIEEHGDRVQAIRFDLGDEAIIEAAAKEASDVDIVIANAGVLKTATAFSDDVYEALQFELDGNLFGRIRTVRAFAPVLKANGGGAFVQLNSVVSVKSFPDFATYCASKAAAYSMTQALRFQLAEQGTSVFSVHPGPIATDMGDAAGLTEVAQPASLVSDAILEAFRTGEFHVWPDDMAKQIAAAYESFSQNVVEMEMSEA